VLDHVIVPWMYPLCYYVYSQVGLGVAPRATYPFSHLSSQTATIIGSATKVAWEIKATSQLTYKGGPTTRPASA
jgi:hypothetical protein